MDAEAREFLRSLSGHIYIKLLTAYRDAPAMDRVEAADYAIEAAEIFVEQFGKHVDSGD